MTQGEGPEGAGTDHRYEVAFVVRTNTFLARCSCGWSSRPLSTSGLAGTVWDRHIAVDVREHSAGSD